MFGPAFTQPRISSQPSHSFAQVPRANIPRSSFNRSHGHKTTFDAGLLIPFYVDEALPGDTFNLSMTSFARLATPIAPVMDNLYCDVFFFAVPYRLVWNNWERFNGAQDSPGASTAFLTPKMAAFQVSEGSIFDYFGLPIGHGGLTPTAFQARAYNLIWNEWFRDQNLQTPAVVNKGDGPDAAADYPLRRRGKRHDYFTSCLPWPQKGTAVSLPLGISAPITSTNAPDAYGRRGIAVAGSGSPTGISTLYQTETASPRKVGTAGDLGLNSTFSWPLPTDTTYNFADLTAATAATINQLREAFSLQRLFESDARGGTRYTEIIRSHFGVTSPDYRLQRPEFLGGGSTPINMAPIPQTSGTGTTPQGNLAAMGTFSHNGTGFVKSFTEHRVLLGLLSVRADLSYQQGINRMWSRNTRYDFYWPALAHLGEQAVLNKEIYYQNVSNTDNAVFGYQERYAEYRYKPSLITGKMRSTATGTLDLWHLSQRFLSTPVLGDTFIQENPPVARVLAVPTQPHFIFDSAIKLTTARPMPVYSVPGLVDRF